LPYNRAAELESYVRALFEMALADEGRLSELRREMRQQLETAPFNETMHRLFYEVVARAGRPNGGGEARA
jgi:DNA-binding SARP family transcriptional activator